MLHDRFAHQNRFGPQSEFLLASSSSDIIHHLSGFNEFTNPLTLCFIS
ncbi:unnamed protein product [Onchocerca flexuosa]|uniref:Uncharacterized protein n=1 Tax=Onchocerca flexuosa TaxID=387005 RepID=A0A183HV48_9BILA|nr:unnamed protein product [Onchocerca flexuosa]